MVLFEQHFGSKQQHTMLIQQQALSFGSQLCVGAHTAILQNLEEQTVAVIGGSLHATVDGQKSLCMHLLFGHTGLFIFCSTQLHGTCTAIVCEQLEIHACLLESQSVVCSVLPILVSVLGIGADTRARQWYRYRWKRPSQYLACRSGNSRINARILCKMCTGCKHVQSC